MARAARRGSAGPALFFAGLALLAVLAFVSAWPDMEASVFDAGTSLAADEALRSMDCPVMIAADETSSVAASFANRSDRPESFLVRSRVTRGFITLVKEDTQQVHLEPGEERTLSWPIEADNAAYRRLVMARVLATRSAVHNAREGSCGVLVIGVTGISGQALFAVLLLAALALVAAGATDWWWRRRPLLPTEQDTVRRVGALAALVAASLVLGLLGWWLPSHLALVTAALYAVLLGEQTVTR
ncbi:MAG: hypothetical protein ACK2T6_01310 [Anaerolineae bacterium]|jgi:hypothetical protein